jgi:hypothetical protein
MTADLLSSTQLHPPSVLRRPSSASRISDSRDSRSIPCCVTVCEGFNQKFFAQGSRSCLAREIDAFARGSLLAGENAFGFAARLRPCEKPLFHGHFAAIEENQRALLPMCAQARLRCAAERLRTQDMVCSRARTRSIQRKCWFFCHGVVMRMPCSRSRGHDTTSPLTQTRRAAWRRSERRRRSQRRRRALVRRSAGRRSKVVAASVFDFE